MTSHPLSRRAMLRMLGAVSLAASPARLFAQTRKDLQKVRIAVAGTPTVNANYYWLTLPIALGYWEDEGYDVEVFAVPGSLQAVQQLATGGIEFAAINANVLIQANTMNNIPVRPISVDTVVDWGVAVKADGPLKAVTDLKGKSVGIVSLASGGIALLKAFLAKNGLELERDVHIIAVGAGAPALDALQSGRVEALMFWGSELVSFEGAGAKLRIFRDPVWASYPDYSVCALQSLIDRDPKMAEAIARGIAKATEFTMTSVECALDVHWKRFPDTRPTGVDEATARKRDLASMQANIDANKLAYEMVGHKGWAWVEAKPFEQYQDFLFASGLINKKLPGSTYVVARPGFFERANQFDHAAVVRAAQTCKT
jgi:NitT/TauT family transport system substrate-binding protein